MNKTIDYEDGTSVELDEDDALELDDTFFREAKRTEELPTSTQEAIANSSRIGRPRSPHPKQQISLRVDQDVLQWLKTQGPGYQSRINTILREAMERQC